MKRAMRPLVWGLSLCAVAGLHGAAWHWLATVVPETPLVVPAASQAMAVDMLPAPPAPVPIPEKPAPAPVMAPQPEPISAPVASSIDDALPLPPAVPRKPPRRPRHVTPPRPPQTPAPSVAAPAPARAKPSPPPASVSQAAQENWESRLLGRLLAVRRYPPEAAARDQQGIADVRVTIAADGQVVRASLVKSSGYPVLDTEALAWIRRASPLPPPPGAAPVTLVVPLRFHIDDADDPA